MSLETQPMSKYACHCGGCVAGTGGIAGPGCESGSRHQSAPDRETRATQTGGDSGELW